MEALGSFEMLAYKYKTTRLHSLFTSCWFFGLLFDPEFGGNVSLKRRLNSTGLHGVTLQMTVPFIVSAVRTASTAVN
jgi:hypothetical protein